MVGNYLACRDESPPSTEIVCPVIQALSGERRKKRALAISLGVPRRPSGCMASENFLVDSLPVIGAASGVSVSPGATQLIRSWFLA